MGAWFEDSSSNHTRGTAAGMPWRGMPEGRQVAVALLNEFLGADTAGMVKSISG